MKIHQRRRAFVRDHPEQATAQEELSCLLAWAEQQRFDNIAAALRRVLAKLKEVPAAGSAKPTSCVPRPAPRRVSSKYSRAVRRR